MENPLHHFELHPLVHLSFMGFDISINKAVIAMWIGMAVVFSLFMVVIKGGLKLIPGKMQSIAEMLMEFLKGLVEEFIGKRGFNRINQCRFILATNNVGIVSRTVVRREEFIKDFQVRMSHSDPGYVFRDLLILLHNLYRLSFSILIPI